MMNGVQNLFNKLIERYNLRAITIDGETWYGINDLPINKSKDTFYKLRKEGQGDFVDNNTKMITNSGVANNDLRNFDKVNNAGETFGNYEMINYLIMNSRLGSEYKIELIKILKQIMTEGYYIDEDITQDQIDKLQNQVDKLKNKLREERTKKVYGSTEIVELINVEGLLSSSLLRYMNELGLGCYKVAKVNRVFKYNDSFVSRCCAKGYARVGVGGKVEFYKEFADSINNCETALKRLRQINQEELEIRNKGVEKRVPF